MLSTPTHLLLAVFLLTPFAVASAQEDIKKAQPARPSIAAMPLIQPAAANTIFEDTAVDAGFADLEADYNAEYASWVSEITALSKQDNYSGTFPNPPTAGFYPRFRTIADTGSIGARMWCLRNFNLDAGPEEFRKQRWQGEAFSLATATYNDVTLSRQLRQSLSSGWVFRDNSMDSVLEYVQTITSVDEIKRSTMARRSSTLLDSDNDALGLALAKELIATWPESDEAARLDGILNSRDTLILGGTPANFSGTDVDGNELSLYDYRGKIVVIDFWGFW
jgi:hypothetical protein